MKFTKSWLLIAILVGVLSKNVFSFPAHRALDLGNELVSEDTDADEADDDDASDSKKADIAKEGSGDTAKKTSVESKEEEEEEDDADEEAADNTGSGSASDAENANVDDDKSDNVDDSENGEEKAAEEAAPSNYEVAEDDVASKEAGDEEEDTAQKRTEVAKRDYGGGGYGGGHGGCGCGCGCRCGDEECCHHCHEHEGGCHEGCCCGHEQGHHHGAHEHEDCCHHHGHHHGFVHEWGQECCGGHHEHECCGHHGGEHHHEGEHEHQGCCHEGCCGHHNDEGHRCGNTCCGCCGGCGDHGGYGGGNGGGYGGGGNGGGYGWGRSNVPMGYHCHDMVSKGGKEKTKRFCVPVYGYPEVRDHIERPSKKQTVHVGYGYASGDNYRLGYQQGGMGGLASSFTGQIESGAQDNNDHFQKRSHLLKRNYEGHGFGSFNSGMMHGSATPYGHPVTHPGFTTMGYPGHALASQDVRNSVPHPLIKREVFEDESQMQIVDGIPSIQLAPDEIES